ncbi:Structural maintenance of chromosomes protein 6 [Umbelopsis nana]
MQNQNKRKRRHLSNGARDAESDVDSTDISLHEEEEEEEDDFNVEHNVRPARLSLGGNSNLIEESDYGTVESMELVNFMCHKYLKMSFGSKINFVIGHNGSGKSAILTGLTVALGAKATVTNRASNLGALVKAGTSVGQVIVKITNKGPDAYKPDVYGEHIIIERRISKDGASGYKIKSSSTGKTISTKREELAAICDHMSIQVDNPLTILSQDSARQFLNSSTPEDKYKFFMKGSQLTQLSSDYEQIREYVDETQLVISRNKSALDDLHKKAKVAELRYREMLEAQELDDQIDELNNEIVWLQIIAKEKEVASAQLDARKAAEQFSLTQTRYEKQQEKVNEMRQETESLQQQITDERKRALPFAEEQRSVQATIREKEREIQHISDQGREINVTVKTLRSRIAVYDAQIKEEAAKLESANRNRREAYTRQISEVQSELETAQTGFESVEKQQIEVANQEENAKRRKDEMDIELRRTERERSDLEKSIRDMESQRENRLRAFGQKMPELVEVINRERRWRGRTPVGPFGRYIKLECPEFANVLETTIGRMLNNFVVETFEDKRLLSQMLDRMNLSNCQIFVAKYDIFDYSSGEPDPHFLTTLRALKFENEWVKRQMIIAGGIEKIILMTDRAEADRIMYNNGQPLRNVKTCFTSQGHRVGASKGMRTESLPMYRGSPRLSADVEGKLRETQQRLEGAKQAIQLKQKDVTDLNKKLSDFRRMTGELEAEKRRLHTRIRQLRNKQSELEDKMKEDEPVNIAAIEEEKKELEDEIELYRRQFADMRSQMLKAKEAKLPFEQQHKSVTDKIAESDTKLSNLRAQLVDKTNEYEVKVRELTALKNKLEGERIRVEGLKRHADEIEAQCQQWTNNAKEVYPDRVEPTKTIEQLNREVRYLETRKKEQEDLCGATLEDVQEEAKKALKEWDNARKSIEELEGFVKNMSKALHDRMERWTRFLMFIALRAKIHFSYYMYKRGDSGTLHFNHRKQRLDVKVATGDQYQKGTRHKDSKSLSGGEKSFSQISLLLSLWQGIASPMFCLDEFDVYMDAVNRKQSMRMMIEAARENSSQYILITPQDASSVSPGPDVMIHRLADPERGDIQ